MCHDKCNNPWYHNAYHDYLLAEENLEKLNMDAPPKMLYYVEHCMLCPTVLDHFIAERPAHWGNQAPLFVHHYIAGRTCFKHV